MNASTIVITSADYGRLLRLIEASRQFRRRDIRHIDELEQELDRAIVARESEIPSDIVTMNSRVRVRDLNSGHEFVYQIVFPREADVAANRISVLAPIGTALLGRRAGTPVEIIAPSGLRRLRILEVVYQPEAAGAAA